MPAEPLREIAGPAGPLDVLLDEPDGSPKAGCVFSHPHPLYGGTMHTKVVYQSAKALARIGVATLRFNFRGVGSSRGAHDGGPGEMADFRAALEVVSARYPGVPLWAAGFSFGAWVAWNVALDDGRVRVLLGLGLPVNRFDFTPVKESAKAKFLIHGELDELVSVRNIRKFYSELAEPKELVVIDGANHLFDGRTSEVGEAVEDLLKDWEA
ncbi:MAG TPA: alpha/beta fold hydrolase [Vicinamibacterales bacterium]|nr:alpha/beta fold hydrolase [Vicinamibacterales bacterium]